MLTTTFTESDFSVFSPIVGAIAAADEAARCTLARIRDRVMLAIDDWQDWSDRTFADVQPELLSIIESVSWLAGYIAAFLWGVSTLACLKTWRFWAESHEQRELLAKLLLTLDYSTVKDILYLAYSVVVIVGVVGFLVGAHGLSNAPRWASKAIGYALCVTW